MPLARVMRGQSRLLLTTRTGRSAALAAVPKLTVPVRVARSVTSFWHGSAWDRQAEYLTPVTFFHEDIEATTTAG
jgi:hypothetical protein